MAEKRFEDWLKIKGRKYLQKAPDTSQFDFSEPTPSAIFAAIYMACRRNKIYAKTTKDDPEIGGFTACETENIVTEHHGGWDYRKPRGLEIKSALCERYSLNAHASPELINKLDAFCSKWNVRYKVPSSVDGWLRCNDTVTIYCSEPSSVDMDRELKKIATPYVREGDLHGERIGKGIYKCKEPSEKEAIELIGRAALLDRYLGECVRAYTTCQPSMWEGFDVKPLKNPALSVGMQHVVETVLEDFTAFQATSHVKKVAKRTSSAGINLS